MRRWWLTHRVVAEIRLAQILPTERYTAFARWEADQALPLGKHLRAAQSNDCADGGQPSYLALNRQNAHQIAVVGAHLTGMPLNGQLQAAGARLSQVTTTSKNYRLYHLLNTTPLKPGLVRVGEVSEAIALEVYDVPSWAVSGFWHSSRRHLDWARLNLLMAAG